MPDHLSRRGTTADLGSDLAVGPLPDERTRAVAGTSDLLADYSGKFRFIGIRFNPTRTHRYAWMGPN